MNVTKEELRNLLFSAATISLIKDSDNCKAPLAEIYGFSSNDVRIRATCIWNAISKEGMPTTIGGFSGEDFFKTDLIGDYQRDILYDKESL